MQRSSYSGCNMKSNNGRDDPDIMYFLFYAKCFKMFKTIPLAAMIKHQEN